MERPKSQNDDKYTKIEDKTIDSIIEKCKVMNTSDGNQIDYNKAIKMVNTIFRVGCDPQN